MFHIIIWLDQVSDSIHSEVEIITLVDLKEFEETGKKMKASGVDKPNLCS